MKRRININRVDPAAYTALEPLDNYIESVPIDQVQKEFIRIRASQINGCAYCVNMHSKDARNAGASEQRVYLVSAWKEAGNIFSDEERLVLKMTEEVTLIHQNGLSEETYEKAIATFGEQKTAQIIMTIISINAWTRIGVATEMRPPIDAER